MLQLEKKQWYWESQNCSKCVKISDQFNPDYSVTIFSLLHDQQCIVMNQCIYFLQQYMSEPVLYYFSLSKGVDQFFDFYQTIQVYILALQYYMWKLMPPLRPAKFVLYTPHFVLACYRTSETRDGTASAGKLSWCDCSRPMPPSTLRRPFSTIRLTRITSTSRPAWTTWRARASKWLVRQECQTHPRACMWVWSVYYYCFSLFSLEQKHFLHMNVEKNTFRGLKSFLGSNLQYLI